jgi:Phage integrase family
VDFLFPACETAHIDPTKPIKSWRTAWRRLTRAIQCAGCGLLQNPGETCGSCKASIANIKSPFTGFRFHDLRHQAITELAESKASDSTIMSIAGHVSRKMLAHYSHVRLDAKRNALDALTMGRGKEADSERTSKGYDTNSDTKVSLASIPMPHVIDSMVELSGIEPLTSSLRTRRSPS